MDAEVEKVVREFREGCARMLNEARDLYHEAAGADDANEREGALIKADLKLFAVRGVFDAPMSPVADEFRGAAKLSERTVDDAGFGRRLKSARERAGLTRTQLGRAAGWSSHAAVAQFELGNGMPGATQLARLAQAVGVTIDYLLFADR